MVAHGPLCCLLSADCKLHATRHSRVRLASIISHIRMYCIILDRSRAKVQRLEDQSFHTQMQRTARSSECPRAVQSCALKQCAARPDVPACMHTNDSACETLPREKCCLGCCRCLKTRSHCPHLSSKQACHHTSNKCRRLPLVYSCSAQVHARASGDCGRGTQRPTRSDSAAPQGIAAEVLGRTALIRRLLLATAAACRSGHAARIASGGAHHSAASGKG